MSDPAIDAYWDEQRVFHWRGQHRGTDETVYEFASAALTTLKPRLMLVNFQDPDYAHWGVPYFYFRSLRRAISP